MLNVETIRKVRQAHFRDGKGIREITRDFNLSRNTVRSIIRSGIIDQKVRAERTAASQARFPLLSGCLNC